MGPVPARRVACATRERATWECGWRSLRYPFGAGPCRPARSVTRRKKPGQTRSPSRLCRSPTAAGGSGGQHLYCAPCDPTTHVRVSLRDRRDTRPHTHHLPRHPDVRRPAVQGPAAVDGAHAGARPVRPGGQADAPLRHLQARRHRRLHAPADWSQDDDTPFIKRVIGARRRHRRDPRRRASTSTAPRSTSRTSSPRARRPAAADDRPGDEHQWVIPEGELFLMGDHRAELGRLARHSGRSRVAGHRSGVAALLAARHASGSSRRPPTRSWRRRRHEPPAVNPALAGVALAVMVGAVVAGSARNARTAILGLVVVLVAAPLLADPPARAARPGRPRASAPCSPAISCGSPTRGPAARTGGSPVGWPTDAFLAAAAAVVGLRQPRPGRAGGRPGTRRGGRVRPRRPGDPAVLTGRDIMRVGIGLSSCSAGRSWSGRVSAARPMSSRSSSRRPHRRRSAAPSRSWRSRPVRRRHGFELSADDAAPARADGARARDPIEPR